MYVYEFTNPPHGQDVTQGKFFKRGLIVLNSEFSFFEIGYLTKAKKVNLSFYLPTAWGRIIQLIRLCMYAWMCVRVCKNGNDFATKWFWKWFSF